MEIYLLSFAALFSVINPLGTVPIFVGLTGQNSKREKAQISFFTALYVFVILGVSFYLGKYILIFFGITLEALKIAGGMIIVSSGFALLSGNFTQHKGMKKREKDDAFNRSEISLTPLAIPMLAGPGTISLLITYQKEYQNFNDQIWIVAAIVSVSASIYLILKSGNYIVKALGASGLNALSRIIGFIVIAIGVQYVIGAVSDLIFEK
ncbi:MarC family NAAT transporter [Paracrocinitomix mangrovi]|uniref:MarC family NAAT transporter n=1 Tax=Paracrocinitomix mangrovi TaxID=2862509 RepID=UPI001C8D128E|nr:MarC family NAAT transporter [Paracrocinitomix mangrovi]UKN03699.1 MarC family NAAT transporter [Paracrocinitomix mangrovi]